MRFLKKVLTVNDSFGRAGDAGGCASERTGRARHHADRSRKIAVLSDSGASAARNYPGGITVDFSDEGSGIDPEPAGIHAAFLNSSLSAAQYRKALGFAMEGRYKIIYVAPERLLTPEFLCAVQSMEISMLSVDEAHCISQWGQDFRPSYLKITEFVEQLPARPVIGAFTATATKEVRDDIEATAVFA